MGKMERILTALYLGSLTLCAIYLETEGDETIFHAWILALALTSFPLGALLGGAVAFMAAFATDKVDILLTHRGADYMFDDFFGPWPSSLPKLCVVALLFIGGYVQWRWLAPLMLNLIFGLPFAVVRAGFNHVKSWMPGACANPAFEARARPSAPPSSESAIQGERVTRWKRLLGARLGALPFLPSTKATFGIFGLMLGGIFLFFSFLMTYNPSGKRAAAVSQALGLMREAAAVLPKEDSSLLNFLASPKLTPFMKNGQLQFPDAPGFGFHRLVLTRTSLSFEVVGAEEYGCDAGIFELIQRAGPPPFTAKVYSDAGFEHELALDFIHYPWTVEKYPRTIVLRQPEPVADSTLIGEFCSSHPRSFFVRIYL